MKLSYSQKLGKYVVTELGRLIDSDEDFCAIGLRHGFLSDEEQEELLDADDDDQLSDDTATDDDDDLDVIRKFLEEEA